MIPFGPQIQAIGGKLGQWKGALSTASMGFKSLGGAILSTGLGALVIALGLVITITLLFGVIILLLRVMVSRAINYLLQFPTAKPYTTAGWTIINFNSLLITH